MDASFHGGSKDNIGGHVRPWGPKIWPSSHSSGGWGKGGCLCKTASVCPFQNYRNNFHLIESGSSKYCILKTWLAYQIGTFSSISSFFRSLSLPKMPWPEWLREGWGLGSGSFYVPHCTENLIYLYPKKGIARPQSQFLHPCVCERYIYTGSVRIFGCSKKRQTDFGIYSISLTDI